MKRSWVLYLLLAILFAVPFTGEYPTYLTGIALLFGLAALALNVLLGYTGLLSFGNALFFGTGAYTVGLLVKHFDITSIEILIPASIATSVVVALGVGFICVRHTRIYFTMLTIAIASLFYALAQKLRPITGGDDGIRIHTLYLFGREMVSISEFYYLALTVFIVSVLILRIILMSPLGLALQAVRDSEVRAKFAGISVVRYRLAAFLISGVFTGLSGAVYAVFLGQVSPDDVLSITRSGEFVAMTLLGGFSSFIGPIVGAFVFTFLKALVSSAVIYWYLVSGAIIVSIVLFLPTGIMGEVERRLRRG